MAATGSGRFDAPLIVLGDEDDDALARPLEGALGGRLRVVVVRSVAESLGKLDCERLGAVVTRARLGNENGLLLASMAARHDPEVPMLVLAQHRDWADVREAFRIGATYLPHVESETDVLGDVLLFLARRVRMTDRRRAASLQLLSQHRLRGRAADLLVPIGDGMTPKELPFALGVSANSIKAPLRILFRETGTYTVDGVLHRIDSVGATLFASSPQPPSRTAKASGVMRVRIADAEPAVHPIGVKTGGVGDSQPAVSLRLGVMRSRFATPVKGFSAVLGLALL